MTTPQALIVAVVVLAAAVPIVRFELFCLRDLAGAGDQQLQYLTRAGWTALIIMAIPLGGIAYLSYGRAR